MGFISSMESDVNNFVKVTFSYLCNRCGLEEVTYTTVIKPGQDLDNERLRIELVLVTDLGWDRVRRRHFAGR